MSRKVSSQLKLYRTKAHMMGIGKTHETDAKVSGQLDQVKQAKHSKSRRLEDAQTLPDRLEELKRMSALVPNSSDIEIGIERNRPCIEQLANSTMVNSDSNLNTFKTTSIMTNKKLEHLLSEYKAEEIQEHLHNQQSLEETRANNAENKNLQVQTILIQSSRNKDATVLKGIGFSLFYRA